MALKYAVLQAGVPGNTGGVAWSVGPHPGGRWETGVPEFAKRLGDHVRRIETALFGTRPSVAYPTPTGTPLRSARIVSTESQDGKTTYLHVLWQYHALRALDAAPRPLRISRQMRSQQAERYITLDRSALRMVRGDALDKQPAGVEDFEPAVDVLNADRLGVLEHDEDLGR